MNNKNKLIILILGLFFNCYATISSDSWDLDRCIDYGLSNNPNIKSAIENINSIIGQNEILLSEFIPKLNASYSTLTNNQKIIQSSANKNVPPSQYSKDVYSVNVNVTDTIYSKKMAPTFELIRLNLEVSNSKIKQVKNDLVMNIKKTFYTVIFTEQAYKISLAAESVAKDNYNTSISLYKEGKVSSFDVSRTKVRWISAKADAISAKNDRIVSLENLKTILSLQSSDNFEIKGKFLDVLKKIELEKSIQEALTYRPEMEQIKFIENIKKYSVDVAKSGLYPSLNAALNYSLASPDINLNLNDQYKSWSAMFSVSIPIFDGKLTKGKIKTAESELVQTLFNKKSIEDNIIMEIRQAYFTFKNAEESLNAQKESVTIAKENLKIARERYSMGLLSLLELKDVELALIATETQYIKTLYNYHTAFVSVDRAIGLPFRS